MQSGGRGVPRVTPDQARSSWVRARSLHRLVRVVLMRSPRVEYRAEHGGPCRRGSARLPCHLWSPESARAWSRRVSRRAESGASAGDPEHVAAARRDRASCLWRGVDSLHQLLLVLRSRTRRLGDCALSGSVLRVGLVVCFYGLAERINRTVWRVSPNTLSVTHGPLPFRGLSVPLDRIGEVFVVRDEIADEGGSVWSSR